MFSKILVAVDGSDVSNKGLATAADLAERYNALLIVVHAVDENLLPTRHGGESFIDRDKVLRAWRQEGDAVLKEARQRLEHKPIQVETVLIESDAQAIDEQIALAASNNGVDLLVIGSHGRRGLKRLFLGSVAEKLARKVDCAVFIVKGDR